MTYPWSAGNSNFQDPGVWLDDGVGMRYNFVVFSIHARPDGANAVYAFRTGSGSILYIGKAKSLSDRLSSHERMDEALRRGAEHLLIHRPGPTAQVPYDQAEERLIRAFSPVMNTKHNTLAGLLSGIGAASAVPAGVGMGLINRTPSTAERLVGALGLASGLTPAAPPAVPVGNGFGMNPLAAFIDTLNPKPGMPSNNALADLMRALEPEQEPNPYLYGFGGILPRT